MSSLENDVLSGLRIIASDLEGISLVGNEERVPIVKLAGHRKPTPMRSLGGGMSRMFGIALALVNAKDGLLLIDEVDTGIHYSVLPDLWRLIFEVAHRLNVQVFATSHSRDCIEAFQMAAQEDKHEEGMLIRLENKQGEATAGGDISATLFDERKLAVATREHIEVR